MHIVIDDVEVFINFIFFFLQLLEDCSDFIEAIGEKTTRSQHCEYIKEGFLRIHRGNISITQSNHCHCGKIIGI
jgi:hypothetical protein